MKYHADQTKMWDAWFLNVDGEIHAYHIQMPTEGCSLPYKESWDIGHAVSDDLLHWKQCPNTNLPLLDEAYPKDYHSKCTGCAVTKDNKHYLFYGMTEKDTYNQRIGAALSDNTYDWIPYENNPVLEPDSCHFIGYGLRKCEWGLVDCRDFIIVQNPDDGLYYGYFAASADIGRSSPVGVIGVSVSSDLLHWSEQSIAYVPRSNGMIEVPDVYCIDGKWYLTVLTGNHYYGRAATKDEYVTNCTIYAVADNPRGPFIEPDDNILIGGIGKSGFTCRTVEKDGKRYVLYVDRPAGIETISLPKEVKVNHQGELGVYWASVVENLRTKTLIEQNKLPEIQELPQTSFAWKTYGGTFEKEGGKYIAKTEPDSWQAAGFSIGAKNIEYNADITLHAAAAAGLWISSRDEGKQHNYIFMLEPDKQRLLLTEFYNFEYYAARIYPFKQNTTYHIKLLMIEGVCELYIDGQLVLQCAVEMYSHNHGGLFCDRGQAEFQNISLYSLEE